MHFRISVFLGISLCWLPALGQINRCVDSYTFSLSGSETALSNLYSVNNNQAGLAFYRKTALAIDYHNRYFIPELSGQTIIATSTLGKGTAGVSIYRFGAKSLNESKYSLAYGRQLNTWLGAGIEMNYHRLEVEAVGESGNIISGNIGLQAIPLENIVIGLQLENPTISKYKNSPNSVLYSGLKAGFSYSLPSSFLITSQFNWERFQKVAVIFGGEYWLIKNLSFRFGVRLINRPSFSFGTGVLYHNTGINLGFERHPVLGFSSAVSVTMKLNNNGR
jgi:hypothetical protein